MKNISLIYLLICVPLLSISQDLITAEFDSFEMIWQLGDNEPMEKIDSSKCEMKFDKTTGKYLFTIFSEEFGEVYQGYEIITSNKDKVIAKNITSNDDMPDLFIVKDSIALKGKIEFIKKENTTEYGEKLFFMFRYSTIPN